MAGRPRRVSDEEILRVFVEHPDPVLMRTEVAERIDIGPEATYTRLEELAQGGLLNSKGEAVNVYWISEGGRAYVNANTREKPGE